MVFIFHTDADGEIGNPDKGESGNLFRPGHCAVKSVTAYNLHKYDNAHYTKEKLADKFANHIYVMKYFFH